MDVRTEGVFLDVEELMFLKNNCLSVEIELFLKKIRIEFIHENVHTNYQV